MISYVMRVIIEQWQLMSSTFKPLNRKFSTFPISLSKKILFTAHESQENRNHCNRTEIFSLSLSLSLSLLVWECGLGGIWSKLDKEWLRRMDVVGLVPENIGPPYKTLLLLTLVLNEYFNQKKNWSPTKDYSTHLR